MNILWHSNSPGSGSGYGNQTALFAPRLKNAGNDMVISAFYGAEGTAYRTAEGILVLPRGVQPYGNDVIDGHYGYPHWQDRRGADAVISLIDPFVLDPAVWKRHNWCAWTPVDGAPVFTGNVRVLRAARWVWSMSEFGHDLLQQAGFKPIYVPHGVESAIYRPINRDDARRRLGAYLGRDLSNNYLLVTVAANKGTPSRKNFVAMIEAFALFVRGLPSMGIEAHPDALLYIHTEYAGLYQGENLRGIAENFGVVDKVLFPNQYEIVGNMLGSAFLNDVYNAGDCFYLLSSEGFGIPTVEAQMAGCPVIVSDWTASPELCFAGKTVVGLKRYMAITGVYWYDPVVPEAAKTLQAMYAERDNQQLRVQARTGAQEYDADRVFADYMKPAVERMRDEIEAERAQDIKRKADKEAQQASLAPVVEAIKGAADKLMTVPNGAK